MDGSKGSLRVSWKISREKEKPAPVAGTEEIARFLGGGGHARPVLVRDDAVDSAHGAAAEGGDGGDVRVSARSRFRSCARGAAGSGGDGALHALREESEHPTDGAQSSTGGGICFMTHRPSSRPRPSREKLGNGSIVVMICGGVIDASVARLQPGLRAQTCARGGDQQAGWVLRNHWYLRSTLEQRAGPRES